MKKFVSILAAVMVIAALSISCSKDNSSKKDDSQSGTSSLSGTTWTTGEQMGFGTLTLSFTAKDCTLKLTNGGKSESCTYPYTYSDGTVKTKVKLSVWSGGEEQDATGTVNGNGMNFKLAKNGSNYYFSKK